ncbi:hypothetical protein Cantr_00919 [Candida viswanathii]|uniref:Uncharacterized protein n=1 Tax=Candida viswanathii TaxID=5486 RepID=A0A367YGI9_9ASCO|nr:hypothetical protein Cantr_00919 [Candida viswanathii]
MLRRYLLQSRPVILRSTRVRRLSTKEFFEETAAPKKRSLPEKLSQYFTDILVNEGQKIADEPIQKFVEQVPDLADDLQKSLGRENKLFTVLTYDPIIIDPRLYLHFINNSIPKDMKRLYFERLLYHRCYTACWSYFAEHHDTLSDLDDFLELINGILLRQGQYKFAILDFVISLPPLLNANLHNQIIDSLEYTVKPEFDVKKVLGIWKDMHDAKSVEQLTAYYDSLKKSFEVDTLYLKRLMQLLQMDDDLKHQTIVGYLCKFPEITSRNGWINLVFPPFESSTVISNLEAPSNVIPFISSLRYLVQHQAKLNETDVLYALHGGVMNSYIVYTGYIRTTNKPNRRIINHLTSQLLDRPNELLAVYKAGLTCLEPRLLLEALKVLVPLKENIRPLLSPLGINTQEMVIRELLDKLTNHQLYDLIVVYKKKQKIARGLITTLTTLHNPTAEQLTTLIPKIKSKQTLLELNRSTLLRAKIIDTTFVTTMFNKLLLLTMPKVIQDGDFKQQFEFATNRPVFHSTIRAYCQTLALLDPPQLAQMLSILVEAMDSSTFYYANDSNAKKYLTKVLHRETFQFIKRRLTPREFVLYLNSVVEIGGNTWLKHWLLKAIVLEDFTKAVELLEMQQIGHYIEAIVAGIISNKQLVGVDRIRFLQVFLNKLKENGMSYTLKQRDCYALINLCIKEGKGDEVKRLLIKLVGENPKNLTWVLSVVQQSGKFKSKRGG